MDFLGYLSFSIPVFGELIDIVWAPFSAIVFYKLFGGKKGAIGAVFNFIEELLPGFDFIPSFSIMYLLQNILKSKQNPQLKTN